MCSQYKQVNADFLFVNKAGENRRDGDTNKDEEDAEKSLMLKEGTENEISTGLQHFPSTQGAASTQDKDFVEEVGIQRNGHEMTILAQTGCMQ